MKRVNGLSIELISIVVQTNLIEIPSKYFTDSERRWTQLQLQRRYDCVAAQIFVAQLAIPVSMPETASMIQANIIAVSFDVPEESLDVPMRHTDRQEMIDRQLYGRRREGVIVRHDKPFGVTD